MKAAWENASTASSSTVLITKPQRVREGLGPLLQYRGWRFRGALAWTPVQCGVGPETLVGFVHSEFPSSHDGLACSTDQSLTGLVLKAAD